MAQLTSMQVLSIAAATSIALISYYLVRHSRSKKRVWKPVAVVSELLVYPIKVCRPVSVQSLKCYDFGCEDLDNGLGDRCLMLVSQEGQRIIGSAYPILTTVDVARVQTGKMRVSVAGSSSIEFNIPDVTTTKPDAQVSLFGYHGFGIKCNDDICEWFSNLLGIKVNLLYHDQNKPLFHRDKLKGYDEISPLSEELVKARFQNFSPLNLISESSLDDLNTRLETPVSNLNFRANVVVTGSSPYDEDNWTYMKIGSTQLSFAKHCNRCPQTTVDRIAGVTDKNMQPLKTLRTYRKPASDQENKLYKGTPKFAIDLVPTQAGIISVGDTVYASM